MNNTAYNSNDRNYFFSQLEALRTTSKREMQDKRYSASVSRAIIPLLMYVGDLKELDIKTLSRMGNMGTDVAKMVYRLLQGESIDSIISPISKKSGVSLAGKVGWTS